MQILNGKEILQQQLARGLGLDRYAFIMRGEPSSPEFQRVFNGYYRVRRSKEWQCHYYGLFDKARESNCSFEQTIKELYTLTGNVEASYTSKLIATIDSSKPIWDQYVLRNLGLELTGRTKDEKMQNAITLYEKIEKWYDHYLSTNEARENIDLFDRILPDYAWISDVKKIDCLLWSKRDK